MKTMTTKTMIGVQRKTAVKSRQDEDDEDRPRKSATRSSRDDDDDDRQSRKPAAKSQSKKYDDDDDRRSTTRKKKKKKQKNQGNGLMIGLIGGRRRCWFCLWWAAWSPQLGIPGRRRNEVASVTPPPSSNSYTPQGESNPSPQATSRPKPSTRPTKPDAQSQPSGNLNTTPNTTPTTQKEELSKELTEKTRRATTYIFTHVDILEVGSKKHLGTIEGSGSGFLMHTVGDTSYIITNHHVVSPLPKEEKDKDGSRQIRPPGPGRPPAMPGPPIPRPPPAIRPPHNPLAPHNPNRPQIGGPTLAEAKVSVKVMFNRGTNEEQFIDAEVVAWDEDADLAALRIKGARNLPAPLELADETSLIETMNVNIFGFPGGVKNIYIGTGKVSQLRRDEKTNELVDVQINGQINPGNSGGPVVDNSGRLVGIAVSYVPGKNLGFAIPTVHLTHMLRGSIRAGIMGSVKQQGNAMVAHADVWRFDRKNRINGKTSIEVPLDANKARTSAPNEYHIMAMLTDPMHKIGSATLHYGVSPPNSLKMGPQGWTQLPNAQNVPLKLEDQFATVDLKLPQGIQSYAFQFSYMNGDNQLVFTEPFYPANNYANNNLKSIADFQGGNSSEASAPLFVEGIRPKNVHGFNRPSFDNTGRSGGEFSGLEGSRQFPLMDNPFFLPTRPGNRGRFPRVATRGTGLGARGKIKTQSSSARRAGTR